MKTVMFLFLLIWSAQSQAMVLGNYECVTEFEGEEAHYGLILDTDRLEIHIDHEIPNDVYRLGNKKTPYVNKLITKNDGEQGIEAIEYKYFQQNVNTLRLIVRIVWIDGETKHDMTISQDSDDTLEVYSVESAQGEDSISVDRCTQQTTY